MVHKWFLADKSFYLHLKFEQQFLKEFCYSDVSHVSILKLYFSTIREEEKKQFYLDIYGILASAIILREI